MQLSDIALLIASILKFPNTILAFIKILKKTPQENHEELLSMVAKESEKFEQTGRPTWDS